jgi:ketosteroid isomerase-like protein
MAMTEMTNSSARAAAYVAITVMCVVSMTLPGCANSRDLSTIDFPPPERHLETALDSFHAAAARADGRAYFNLFAKDGVFIGTDASERWTVDQFKAYAEPYFSQGKGWVYTPREGARHITLNAAGDIAWFDELLDSASYGTSRGTGVLVREKGEWKIAQYALTFPIPNDLAKELTAQIKAHERTPEERARDEQRYREIQESAP